MSIVQSMSGILSEGVWQYIVAVAGALFAVYKIVIQRQDSLFLRKAKRIETIADIENDFHPNIVSFVAAEKINHYYGTNLTTEVIKACLSSSEPQRAFKFVKSYPGLISVKYDSLAPRGFADPDNIFSAMIAYTLMSIIAALSMFGMYIASPRFNPENATGGLAIFSLIIFMPMALYSLIEISKTYELRGFFKRYLKQVV